MAVDDGTGVIQCVNWIPDKYQSIQDTSKIPELQVHELGEVIRVHGQPTEFKGSMQITFQPGDSATCNDPNEETVFRLRVLNQERSVYRKPIVLPDIILSEIDIQDSKKESLLSSSSPGLSEMTLMNKIKEWIASRDEFCYLDLEDDEENNRIACDLAEAMHPNLPLGFRVQHEASRLMNECVKQLVLEGVLEYRNRKHMILAVVRSSVRTSTTAAGAAASSSAAAMTRQETPELVEVERGALVRHPIVLVDSGDEEDTA
ncbi:hypothetical protein EDD11_002821 [Mortierella claussenii]|nr:hypothetical protein EDD11_002821 [Mortierella claussenii]